ncbi:MAG: AlpA family phage regulatory protein [Methylococcaceae bacterium]|nr:AlpA family phage regulatory protein [Methylococcaceae bacterium]
MKQFFPSTIQFRKLPDVKESTGDSRTTHYRKIQDGLMTRPVSRGGGRVAWPGYEIDAINRARVSGFRDEAIKDLVTKLHELRSLETWA